MSFAKSYAIGRELEVVKEICCVMGGRVSVTSSLKEERLLREQAERKRQEPVRRSGMVGWWYRLTTPADMAVHAYRGITRRELIWRAHFASTLLFFLLLLVMVVALPIAILVGNSFILLLVCLLLPIIVLAMLFNRCGKAQIAGGIVACGLSVVLYSGILTNSGGLTLCSLLLLNVLVVTELFVATLLPGSWLFLAVLINSLFIATALLSMPETPALAQIMQANTYIVLACLIFLHVVVSEVVWLLVRSATQANERADQAEEAATLQHAIAEREHIIAQQKRLLDNSIGQIMCTHVQVANGDLAARVPLQNVAALRPLAMALNNLLSRLQRLRQSELEFLALLPRLQRGKLAEYELQHAKDELEHVLLIMRECRASNRSFRVAYSGTLLDPLFQEMNGLYISHMPASKGSMTVQLAADELLHDQSHLE